ncbi:hypothetical protein DPSP01_006110 [Paraphaeosphaeria sporulosa]
MSRPIWSTGCHACRKMKKKCDGAKPGCVRCKKAGRECPGYRSAQQVMFRSMNESAMARANKPTMLATISGGYNPFFIQPSTDWAQFAISHFVYHYVEPPSEYGLPGYLEFLPTMLNSADSSLQTSLLAASLANLANVSGMEQLHTESRIQYGRALRSLHTALSDKATATDDHTLLAVVLLQKYETITGNVDLEKDPHEKATTAMMRLRRPDHESLSNRSSSLSRVVLIRKEIKAMTDRTDSNMEVGERYVDTKQTVGSGLRMLLRDVFIASRGLEVCTAAQDIATGSHMTAFTEAWKFAVEVYNHLILWPSTVPPAWKMKAYVFPMTPSHIDGLTNREGQVYAFSSLQHGAVYGAYQCSRINICQSLRKAYRFIHQQPRQLFDSNFEPSQGEVLETLNSAVDDIFGTSPFMLGDVTSNGQLNATNERRALGAFFLLRSVYVALSVDTLTQPQSRKLLHLLGRIGSEFGIKTASNRRDKWLAQHPDRL